jgi:hypothetical protein
MGCHAEKGGVLKSRMPASKVNATLMIKRDGRSGRFFQFGKLIRGHHPLDNIRDGHEIMRIKMKLLMV